MDRELLEWAAKAAGFVETAEVRTGWKGFVCLRVCDADGEWLDWNPLTDDGDALRLAVKLQITVEPRHGTTACYPPHDPNAFQMEYYEDDKFAATRRCIVRAAAEIGKSGSAASGGGV